MLERTLTITLNGRLVSGTPKEVLDELAFEHYPVAVDAGEGAKEFPSFDTAREYVRALFSAPADCE